MWRVRGRLRNITPGLGAFLSSPLLVQPPESGRGVGGVGWKSSGTTNFLNRYISFILRSHRIGIVLKLRNVEEMEEIEVL